MPSLVIANAVQVKVIWSRAGLRYAINVYGATGLGPTGVNQALANTVGANVKSLFTSSTLVSAIHNSVSLEKVAVRSIGAANQPEFEDAGAAVPGTAVGNFMPPQVCLCVTMRTALAGKEFRGRSYIGGFSVGSADANGASNAGAVTAVTAFVDGLRTGQFGAALTLSVLSRKNLVATPVTLVLSRTTTFETQRRRAIPGI